MWCFITAPFTVFSSQLLVHITLHLVLFGTMLRLFFNELKYKYFSKIIKKEFRYCKNEPAPLNLNQKFKQGM